MSAGTFTEPEPDTEIVRPEACADKAAAQIKATKIQIEIFFICDTPMQFVKLVTLITILACIGFFNSTKIQVSKENFNSAIILTYFFFII